MIYGISAVDKTFAFLGRPPIVNKRRLYDYSSSRLITSIKISSISPRTKSRLYIFLLSLNEQTDIHIIYTYIVHSTS